MLSLEFSQISVKKRIEEKKIKGVKDMEKTKQKISISTRVIENESNWAEYLDYTKFFEPAEINNIMLEFFKKDFI